ncbi:hypothetical protein [Nonomuraea candida]|uniref:hypothetical protein n=1 Tax=Nonomuraea candida TaxID=359159 RepID=UPI0005B88CE1|nr:hypothetical protein [Nonomuraea candida]
MFKKIATGALAVAATTALALSIPGAAQAASYDYFDGWGPVHSRHYLAKADGRVRVGWDRHGESNEVSVRGRLYDLDDRSYTQGGKCAYVQFQAADFDHDWSPVYARRYCGYPGFKRFGFEEHDVQSLRVKVCQVPPHGGYPTKCGPWEYLYTAESE